VLVPFALVSLAVLSIVAPEVRLALALFRAVLILLLVFSADQESVHSSKVTDHLAINI